MSVPPGDRCIALTFDDGPWGASTRQILRILDQYHAKATFFLIGCQVRESRALVRAITSAGHAIGNHSWSHASHPADPRLEVERTDDAIREVLGIRPALFRPPYGLLQNGMAARAKFSHHAVMIWSVDTQDWRRPGAGVIAGRALRGARSGAILLMHDGGGNRTQTVAALPRILSTLRQRGFRFVTVPELLAMRRSAPITVAAKSRRPFAATPVVHRGKRRRPSSSV